MLPQPQKGSAMMIHVTQLNKLSFNVQLDPAMTDALNEASGWSTPERALHSILADALLGPSLPQGYLDDLDNDVPFCLGVAISEEDRRRTRLNASKQCAPRMRSSAGKKK